MRKWHRWLSVVFGLLTALGFGAFPIVFSITLFFWFKDPWFYWQFVMVAIGFLAKEFLRESIQLALRPEGTTRPISS